MSKEIREYVKTCHCCQSVKPNKQKPLNIGHFPVPQKRFSHIHVDVCGPLPVSRGHRLLLTVICRNTRYFDAIPMSEATSKSCAEALLHSWVSKFGLASHCTSDCGTEFVSALWKEMSSKLGIKLNFTPLYSPQTNGLIERQHSTLKNSIKAAMIQMGDQYQPRW